LAGSQPVWISAGSTVAPNAVPAHTPGLRSDLLLRDALVQFATVLVQMQSMMISPWDPTITPLLLDIAARLQEDGGSVVIVVMADTARATVAAQLSVADWRRGKLVVLPDPPPGLAPAEHVRAAIAGLPPKAAIYFGGGREVSDDVALADALGLKRFAIRSTGGAAGALPPGLDYAGGDPRLLHELAKAGSYLGLAKQVALQLP